MKFESLTADMQNAVMNGGKVIVHSAGAFNYHLSTAQPTHQPNYPEFVLECHYCDGLLTADDFDEVAVDIPENLALGLSLNEALVRLMHAKTLAKKQFVNDVRAGMSGASWVTMMYILETGNTPSSDSEQWNQFIVKSHDEATAIVTGEKNTARRTQ